MIDNQKISSVNKNGEVSLVGVGMCLGAHLTPISRSYIENADVCFVAVSNGFVEQWVLSLNSNAISLQRFYEEGKSRNQTYKEMTDTILESLFAGNKVCCAFYGHPGVFAKVPHDVINMSKLHGIKAVMEPGISAEDCLYADLGIDPGQFGCNHIEANHLLIYEKILDPSSYQILWQVGVVGDYQLSSFKPNKERLKVLIERLGECYSMEHEVVIYEAQTISLQKSRIEIIKLKNLINCELNMQSTLVIPPKLKLKVNEKYLKLIKGV